MEKNENSFFQILEKLKKPEILKNFNKDFQSFYNSTIYEIIYHCPIFDHCNINSLSLDEFSYEFICKALINQRNLSTLEICNYYLDEKDIVKIDEILENNKNLNRLIFNFNSLTLKGPTIFINTLSLSANLKILELRSSNWNEESTICFAEFLKQNNILVELDLQDNVWSTKSITSFAESLKVNSSLKKLKFSLNETTGNTSLFSILSESLILNQSINQLELKCKFSIQEIFFLSEILKSNLRILFLTLNFLKTSKNGLSLMTLFNNLAQIPNLSLESLTIVNKYLNDKILHSFSDYLKLNSLNLKEVTLKSQPLIFESYLIINKLFNQNFKTKLDLELEINKSDFLIISQINQVSYNLRNLIFSVSIPNSFCLDKFLVFLSLNQCVEKLTLNFILHEAVELDKFFDYMKNNRKINYLYLGFNILTERNFESLSNCLKLNTYLNEFHIVSHMFPKNGLTNFVKSFKYNLSIKTLGIYFSKACETLYLYLPKILKINQNIENFRTQNLTESALKSFIKYLSTNTSLKKFDYNMINNLEKNTLDFKREINLYLLRNKILQQQKDNTNNIPNNNISNINNIILKPTKNKIKILNNESAHEEEYYNINHIEPLALPSQEVLPLSYSNSNLPDLPLTFLKIDKKFIKVLSSNNINPSHKESSSNFNFPGNLVPAEIGGILYSVRFIKCTTLDERKFILKEIESVLQIRHPHLCQIQKYAIENEGIYLVYEQLKHNCLLSEYLKLNKLTTKNKITLLKQIASCLSELHSRNVVHNNINIGNIYVISDENFKLGEYGSLTNNLGNTNKNQLRKEKPTLKSDVFYFGLLMHIVFSNCPFSHRRGKPDMSVIIENIDNEINLNLIKLMFRTWSTNPQQRPDISEIIEILSNF